MVHIYMIEYICMHVCLFCACVPFDHKPKRASEPSLVVSRFFVYPEGGFIARKEGGGGTKRARTRVKPNEKWARSRRQFDSDGGRGKACVHVGEGRGGPVSHSALFFLFLKKIHIHLPASS